MGFPTVNVDWRGALSVPSGVYAGWLDAQTGLRPAVINIGRQPTFGSGRQLRIEAHVIDGPIDVEYDQAVRVWLEERIRPEETFAGVEALTQQISRDVADARSALQTCPQPPELPWFFNSDC